MFKVRVDTGGTFTDCWGRADQESVPRLVKVLSSGRLRVSVEEWLSSSCLRIVVPENWTTGDGFFKDYLIESG